MSNPTSNPTPSRRPIDLEEAMKNPDLGLITDYVANELPPDQVAEVERRLEEDPAFREFCAPILAFWEGLRQPVRESQAELEASWDRFTRLVEV